MTYYFVKRDVKHLLTHCSGVWWQMKNRWGQATCRSRHCVWPTVLWHCWLGDRKDIRPT